MSKLFVMGVSHRTAPLTLRESLAIPDSELRQRLARASSLCGEALLLSTCNRVELYGSLPDESAAAELRKVLLLAPNQAAALYTLGKLHADGHLSERRYRRR